MYFITRTSLSVFFISTPIIHLIFNVTHFFISSIKSVYHLFFLHASISIISIFFLFLPVSVSVICLQTFRQHRDTMLPESSSATVLHIILLLFLYFYTHLTAPFSVGRLSATLFIGTNLEIILLTFPQSF